MASSQESEQALARRRADAETGYIPPIRSNDPGPGEDPSFDFAPGYTGDGSAFWLVFREQGSKVAFIATIDRDKAEKQVRSHMSVFNNTTKICERKPEPTAEAFRAAIAELVNECESLASTPDPLPCSFCDNFPWAASDITNACVDALGPMLHSLNNDGPLIKG